MKPPKEKRGPLGTKYNSTAAKPDLRTTFEDPKGHLSRRDEGTADPRELVKLPGGKGEDRLFDTHPTGRDTPKEWKKRVKKVGKDGIKNPIEIHKNPDGKVVLFDGNHRSRAAIQAGVKEVPVTVTYFAGSEKSGEAL